MKKEFTIILGIMKIEKANEIGNLLDNAYEVAKEKTRKGMNFEWKKPSWNGKIFVKVEGEIDTIEEFIVAVKNGILKYNVQTEPRNWDEI